MSPYIVTTKPPVQHVGPMGAVGQTWSRRAVATLDEAREAVIDASPEEIGPPGKVYALALQIKQIPEQGGTITLPDGTVIEVEQVGWIQLADMAGVFSGPGAKVLAAFNEAQGGPR